jgi:PglZ domain
MDSTNGSGNGGGAPPVANRAVVEGELKRALHRRPGSVNSLLLLRAAPQWRGEVEFSVEDRGQQLRVAVATCPTVLAVLDALSADRDQDCYLVVLTPCETQEVGESVLARAIEPEIRLVNRWDLVQDAFGAKQLDPKLRRSDQRWLAEALLDAQPAGGWRRLTGPVLTLSTAMNRLLATRLGMDDDADDSAVDAAALLDWSTDAIAVSSFLRLRDGERTGMISWLKETDHAGAVAEVIFGMSPPEKIPDAVPFGIAAAALYGQEGAASAATARIRAEERYFAGHPPGASVLGVFGEAAESLVARWTDNGHAPLAATMCERAELILADLGDHELARQSRVLDAGFDARLTAFADAVGTSLPAAEDALRRVRDHGRRRVREDEVAAAEAAVRVARWLAMPAEEPPATLDDAATRMLRSWGWADWALGVIARADTSRVPRLGAAYAKLWQAGKARRGALDEVFALKLANWTHSSAEPAGLLLVENLMERVARPLAAKRLPVIVVLDGMSVAVGCELADKLAEGGAWLEAGRRQDGREPALATVPSVTAISRTSLLTGTLRTGGQPEEKAGFATFWGRHKSRLFHKGELAPDPGQALSDDLRHAILDPETVVGVVLNTIDDTLDRGKPGGPAHWTVQTVTYLRPILDEARRAGRPVILTADHGHVLDRGHTLSKAQSDSARYRSGIPEPGEIRVRGPRVIADGGEVVAAVDETIHYTPRKAGYHGGAAPAEVVVPVIVLLPSVSLLPAGWAEYDAVGHAPAWWDPAVSAPPPVAQRTTSRRVRPSLAPSATAGGDALFDVSEVTTPDPESRTAAAHSLGARVVASARMTDQRQFARRAPDNERVAALIDGMERAGGRLTLAEAAQLAGEPPVRMSGYLAQVTRLLNVDGYRVLGTTDGGRAVELNTQLLRQQFLGDRP